MCAAIVVLELIININTKSNEKLTTLAFSDIEALAECEESINKGMIITVTVCDRYTPWKDGTNPVRIKCNSYKKDSKCTFTNI